MMHDITMRPVLLKSEADGPRASANLRYRRRQLSTIHHCLQTILGETECVRHLDNITLGSDLALSFSHFVARGRLARSL